MIGALKLVAPALPFRTDPSRDLAAKLPSGYTVLRQYRPKDSPKDRVPLIVVGPGAVLVTEVRDESGRVLCEHDLWWSADRGARRADPMRPSPTRRAIWHAARVRGDLAESGFVRVHVEPVVTFLRARLADCATSPVPVAEGLDGLAEVCVRIGGAERAPERARAIAEVLRAR